jgi:hypothetical protein
MKRVLIIIGIICAVVAFIYITTEFMMYFIVPFINKHF